MSIFSRGWSKPEDFSSSEEQRFDWMLLGVIVAILLIGVINVYSASTISESYTLKQVLWSVGGLGIIAVISLMDYRFLEQLAYPLYVFNLLLLAVVPFAGVMRSGARRWLDLGFINFQPSETMKIVLILALAKFFHNREDFKAMSFSRMLLPLGIILVPTLMTMAQPDLGTGGHLLIIGFSMMLFVGIRWRLLLVAALLAVVSFPVAWEYGLKGYQKDRIRTFIDPMRDPKGKGFNAIQSMIAVGSGRFSGKGFKLGTQTQLNFTPEKHTDFIFTVLAEEWGFIGCFVLLFLYLALFSRCLTLASLARDKFGALLGIGVVAMLLSQVFINVAMVSGIFPIVGLPLPLLSYGGTSMLNTCMALGLILNVGYKRNIF